MKRNAGSPLAHRVMTDGVVTLGLRLLNVAAAAALGVLTARMLGPSGKGLYALPAIEAGLVSAAFTGLNSATAYFLLNRRVGRNYVGVVAAAALILTLAGAAAVVPLAYFSGASWTVVPALIALVPASAICSGMGYAMGTKRVRSSMSMNVITTFATLALVGAGFVLAGHRPSVAIAAWLAANILVGAGIVVWIAVRSRELQGDERVTLGEYLRFCLKIGGVNLVSLLNYRADLYLVALLTNPAVLGVYTIAVSAAEALLTPTQVAALVASPHIGSMDLPAAGRLAARCVRNNLLVAAVVCGAIYVLAEPAIRLLYGRAFVAGVPALHVLLAGVLALSLGSPISTYFTLKLGRPEVALWLASGSAAICIGTTLALLPRMGMLGAAIGSSAGYTAGQAVAIWYFSRASGISPREMLLPTLEDVSFYFGYARRVARGGRRFLHLPEVPAR